MFTCLADVLDSILKSENIWDESQQDPPSEDVPPSEVCEVTPEVGLFECCSEFGDGRPRASERERSLRSPRPARQRAPRCCLRVCRVVRGAEAEPSSTRVPRVLLCQR